MEMLVVFQRECQRIFAELSEWNDGHPEWQKMFGGWLGLMFTAVVLAGSGWADPVRLEEFLRLIVTPLAVFWGFGEYGRRWQSDDHPGEVGPSSAEGREIDWRRTLVGVTHLAGIVAVLAILILVVFVDGPSELWTAFAPGVLIFVCLAITNAVARAVGSRPARFSVAHTVPDVGRGRVLAATLIDSVMACVFSLFLLMMLLAALAVEDQVGSDMLPFTNKDLGNSFDGIWIPLMVFLAVFLVYRWVALRRWGCGLGGLSMRLQLRDHGGERPGRFRLLLRCAFDTVCMGMAVAAVAFLPADRGVPAMGAVVVIAVCVGTNEGRSLTHVLSGTQYELRQRGGPSQRSNPNGGIDPLET
ncbi:MAG: RDD family protein [Caldilineaceae bacterium]|nr:RDD family protein [Caldilineaceae bacterium]MDE0499825.1 RDD family protein [bacterium]MDE0501697.1 RDD family protein [bacterium]